MVGELADLGISLGSQRDDSSGLLLESLDVAQRLFVTHYRAGIPAIHRGDNYHRQIFIDERDRAMLGLARRVPFGVDIGNFLELECAVHCNRVVDRPPHEHEVIEGLELSGQLFTLGISLENDLQLVGYILEVGNVARQLLLAESAAHLTQVKTKQEEHRHLRGERFRRGNADLGAGEGIKRAIGFAGDGGARHVRNGYRARSFAARFALSRSRVRCFARLRDYDGKLALANHRVAIFKFAGVIHIHGYAGQFLDHVVPNHAGMATGAGSNNVDAAQAAQFFVADGDFVQLYPACALIDARRDRIVQALWLLENLLDHVMGEAALVCHDSVLHENCHAAGILPFTMVARTSPPGDSTTRSAAFPGASIPRRSCCCTTRAGFQVASCTACCKFQCANFITLRTARSRVSTLPASFPPERHWPWATSTSNEPSQYLPSGMPVAAIASVMRTARSGPLARKNKSTISGSR